MQPTAFKRRELFQDVLCRCEYADRVVASFDDKIKSEYSGGNRYVSVEGIALEHFSAAPQEAINSTTPSRPHHAVFRSFYVTIANRVLLLLQKTANN